MNCITICINVLGKNPAYSISLSELERHCGPGKRDTDLRVQKPECKVQVHC